MAPSCPRASQRRTAPGKFPGPAAPPSLRRLESFCSCPDLPARRQASHRADAMSPMRSAPVVRAGPGGRAQRDPPRQSRVSRTAARATYGWGGAGLGSPVPTLPGHRLPAQDPAPTGLQPTPQPGYPLAPSSQTPSPCGPRPSGPSLPGERRGRLRSAAPAPRRASPVSERAGRGVRKARCGCPFVGPQLGPVQRLTIPGPARSPRASPPALRAVRAQSGPGQRRGPPLRPIRPRIFPLVGRPGAARQPAPIGWEPGDTGLPLGHRDVRPGRRQTPS